MLRAGAGKIPLLQILRQIVGDIVVVAFVSHENVFQKFGMGGRIECSHGNADPVSMDWIKK